MRAAVKRTTELEEDMADGTFQCPILGCGTEYPHAHTEDDQAALQRDRLFLASDDPLPDRAVNAAKLYRRSLAAVKGIGPRGSSPEADAKWSALSRARETLDVELFCLPVLGQNANGPVRRPSE